MSQFPTESQNIEEAVRLADQALLTLINDPTLKPSEKLKAISLFYKRHQIGGFAPRASKTLSPETLIEKAAIALQQNGLTPTSAQHTSASNRPAFTTVMNPNDRPMAVQRGPEVAIKQNANQRRR